MPERSSHPEARPGLAFSCARLESRHLDQVLAIERASFSQPWAPKLFAAEVVFPRAICLGAFNPAGLLLGYLILWVVMDEAQIQNIAVHPAFRERGLARALLQAGLAQAAARGATWASLEVRPSNMAARGLYASLGFAEVGRRPGYYQPEGEDALLLNCHKLPITQPEGPQEA